MLSAPPSDEQNLRDQWCEFLAGHGIEGVACIASACAGVSWMKPSNVVAGGRRQPGQPVLLAGLGEWVGGIRIDQVVRFMEGH